MKSVLLIGMGMFGQTLGEKLLDMGVEVMIADRNEDVINSLASKYTGALIANCMSADNLQELDIPSYDACVVAIGDDFQSSLEITSILKDLGAKHIVSKASTDIQRKFLFRIGADEVVYPIKDAAEKLAVTLNSKRVYDYFELDADNSVIEIAVPAKWVGRKLIDVDPRGKYGLNILAFKKDKKIISTPTATTVFAADTHMLVFGNTQKILTFTNKIDKLK